MGTPEWAKAVEADTVVETWDNIYVETERELVALAPIQEGSVTLASIWGKLSQDARDNLHESLAAK